MLHVLFAEIGAHFFPFSSSSTHFRWAARSITLPNASMCWLFSVFFASVGKNFFAFRVNRNTISGRSLTCHITVRINRTEIVWQLFYSSAPKWQEKRVKRKNTNRIYAPKISRALHKHEPALAQAKAISLRTNKIGSKIIFAFDVQHRHNIIRLKCSCVLPHFPTLKTTHGNVLPKMLRILLGATCRFCDDEQKLDAPLKFRLNSHNFVRAEFY